MSIVTSLITDRTFNKLVAEIYGQRKNGEISYCLDLPENISELIQMKVHCKDCINRSMWNIGLEFTVKGTYGLEKCTFVIDEWPLTDCEKMQKMN